MRLLAEPTTLMRSTMDKAVDAVVAMVQECIEHGLPTHEFAMHVQLNTDREPKPGVPATFLSIDGKDVMVAPMPFAGFRGLSKREREGAPLLKALLETEGKNRSDLVIACTDHNLDHGFVGYATSDFGLPDFVGLASVASQLDTQNRNLPKHIREARVVAAEVLVGLDPQTASAAIHGGTAWEKMTKARRIAGSDWPEVEDTISMLLCFGTPVDWDDLLVRLAREKTRYGFWWLDEHGEHPAGIAFIVQNPAPLDAIACLKGGMIGEKWTAATCPNVTLGKRLVPMSSTFVWYADEVFAAAEAAEKTKGS